MCKQDENKEKKYETKTRVEYWVHVYSISIEVLNRVLRLLLCIHVHYSLSYYLSYTKRWSIESIAHGIASIIIYVFDNIFL